MPNTEDFLEEVTVNTVLQVLKENNALAKTICSPVNDNRSWEELLPQLSDPQHVRPFKEVDEEQVDRARAYHPGKNIWETKQTKEKRGQPKETIYTKKTSVTLLPTDGKIHLFKPTDPRYQDDIALLFNLQDCDHKDEKYVFLRNVNSNKRWWLKRRNVAESAQVTVPGTTLSNLRNYLSESRSNNIIPEADEILLGVSRKSLIGVAATKNDLFSRLNALAKQNLIKTRLNKIVPVFILTPQNGITVYSEDQQISDARLALTKDKNDPIRMLLENEIDQNTKQKALELIKNKEQKDSELEISRNFLLEKNVPDDLKREVLSHFDFIEITNFLHEIEKSSEYDVLKNIVREEFNKKREKDLDLLTKELNMEINYKTLMKIFTEEQNDFSVVVRAIIHLCYLNPRTAGQLLANYLYQAVRKNLHVVTTFLTCGADMEIKQRKKRVVWIAEDNDGWESRPEITVNMCKWSSLVGAILYNNAWVTRLIMKQYASHISDIMAGLNELQKISLSYSEYCDYSLEDITAAKVTLLEQFERRHANYHTLTYEDKRLLEKKMLTQINQLPTKKSIIDFYRHHAIDFCLLQHRHALYDKIRNRPFSTFKKNVVMQLRNRFDQVETGDQINITAQEKLKLDKAVSELGIILKSKCAEVVEQVRHLTFFSLYSRLDSENKIAALGEALKKLETINTLPELQLFTESLLINNELMMRRTIGISSSDTYNKVKAFYDDCFSSDVVISSTTRATKN